VARRRTWRFPAELVVVFRGLAALYAILRDPLYRALVRRVAVLFAAGTIFYSLFEGWNLLDAFWFSVATLLTASFANLFPTTALTKIFTILYAIVGVGVLLSFVAAVARRERRSNGPTGSNPQAGNPREAAESDGC
jgi:hypothetical protein